MRKAAVVLAIAASGCGGSAGDLLAIDVSGGFEGAKRELVVTEDGRGRCNRGELRKVESQTLIDAREAERKLGDLAREGAEFTGRRADRRTYVARIKAGTVRWVEGAPGIPKDLPETARLALRLERELCR